MYRIVETHITPSYSTLTIQRRFMLLWWNVVVDDRYLCSLQAAQRWIKMKKQGYPVTDYYYEK